MRQAETQDIITHAQFQKNFQTGVLDSRCYYYMEKKNYWMALDAIDRYPEINPGFQPSMAKKKIHGRNIE